MEILIQLGANKTAFIQFGLFIVTIGFLTIFVYGPYFKAFDQRLKLTKGADQVAQETQDEAKQLEQIYTVKAREINDKIKEIYNASKKEAVETTNNKLAQAKQDVEKHAKEIRTQIENEKLKAVSQIKDVSTLVANEITQKIMGT